MELNRETAMRLWNKSYGKETSVYDYAGRKIVKGAYNDRNSEFAWNVDHIYPQSKGGKTNDSNLIICHILTNDEKADKFPCFTANNNKFEIIKVQNHYEINSKSKSDKKDKNEVTNFLDSASGIRLFKDLKGIQNKSQFVSSIFIKLENVKNTAIIDFIEKLFDDENISFKVDSNYYSTITTILLKNYNAPLKEDTKVILDECITLNTYLSSYFKEIGVIASYDVFYRDDYFSQKTDLYPNDQLINEKIFKLSNQLLFGGLQNSLWINEGVIQNAEIFEKIDLDNIRKYSEYYEYNYIYTKLKEDLIKESSRR